MARHNFVEQVAYFWHSLIDNRKYGNICRQVQLGVGGFGFVVFIGFVGFIVLGSPRRRGERRGYRVYCVGFTAEAQRAQRL